MRFKCRSKVLHFPEAENDKQQELAIFAGNCQMVMRKSRQEIKDKAVLEEILSGAEICRLSMVDGELPYIIPVNYGYRDGHIYIHSAREGKKIDLLQNNRLICFEVEDTVQIVKGEKACDWTTRYRSVVGYGTMEILSDAASKQEGLEVIMAQHGASELENFDAENLKRMVILKLRITSLTGKQSSNWDHTF
jgi:nitroimidazol reductase NimA-like FMN-containing flavoprotein (pyridoxamine 5'-phosphate oxidase superfamily)